MKLKINELKKRLEDKGFFKDEFLTCFNDEGNCEITNEISGFSVDLLKAELRIMRKQLNKLKVIELLLSKGFKCDVIGSHYHYLVSNINLDGNKISFRISYFINHGNDYNPDFKSIYKGMYKYINIIQDEINKRESYIEFTASEINLIEG